MNSTNKAGYAKLIGIVTIILGVLAVATPLVAGVSILVLIGILITVAGVLRMVWAVKKGSPGHRTWKILLGLLTVAAGVLVLAHPMMASGILSILLAMYLFSDGLIEIIIALTLESGTPGKGWLFVGGLMSALLGSLLLFQAPLSGVVAIGVFLGIKLIFVGMATVALGTSLRSVMKPR
jgi:uncharacterized membrane protein HdeD (DUF308 family)